MARGPVAIIAASQSEGPDRDPQTYEVAKALCLLRSVFARARAVIPATGTRRENVVPPRNKLLTAVAAKTSLHALRKKLLPVMAQTHGSI